ncbi:DUF6843 domain-containing protein [Altibacter sp. HG106]|uniref:DUF6843 domain-containing protein n=1 Tax=Altibacter sp. HG106 TaxID=3023937 RepID=UPI0023510471|nr:hypothetical protein [Altibacter sp. HG106]MDC7996386.1 hypothetical protein [Altibacter sp. HG106]
MKNTRLAFLLSTFIITACSFQKSENSIIIIPENYSGPVVITFNQENGEPKTYERNSRVYKINDNGVLKTQFDPQYKSHFQKVYIQNDSSRVEVPVVFEVNEDSKDSLAQASKIYAYGFLQSGRGEKYDPDTEELISVQEPELSFYIGSIEKYDESHFEQMKFILRNRETDNGN